MGSSLAAAMEFLAADKTAEGIDLVCAVRDHGLQSG
jgi:hypothetical protein